MKSVQHNVAIRGVVAVIPREISHYDDEITNYAQDAERSRKLKETMGYGSHHLAGPGICTSNLALHGIRALATEGQLDLSQIDALVLVTQTPDYIMPPTSAVMHGALDLPEHVYCVDINDGCNGFVKGLFEAGQLIASGARRVVLAAGDVLSHRVSKQDRNSYPLIGDAVGVAVIEHDVSASPIEFDIRYNGHQHEALMVPAGQSRELPNDTTRELKADAEGNIRHREHLVMKGRDVFAFTQSVVPAFLEEFLAANQLAAQDVDLFLLHQANAFVLDRIAKKLRVDKVRLPQDTAGTFGNSSSATIPVTLVNHLPANRSAKLVCSGFGVGLSWGAALIQTPGLSFSRLIEADSETLRSELPSGARDG
jgi:3-oxoacyl-[acyl-carrier-protein] synthase III